MPHKREFKQAKTDRVPVLARDYFVKIEFFFFLVDWMIDLQFCNGTLLRIVLSCVGRVG
jgi:hypothetical protein